jgi:DNA-binding GntR family transcriptional regulator
MYIIYKPPISTPGRGIGETVARRAPASKSPRATLPASSQQTASNTLAPTAPSPALPSIKKHRTLEELAYRDIRRAIAEGRFAPGQRILVQSVATASGISRIPVMQALRRLESEGFVRITPHKDVVVTTLSPGDFRERFLLMAMLEAFCLREARGRITPDILARLRGIQAGLAAVRRTKNAALASVLDSEFHLLMYRCSGLTQTLQILQNLFDRGDYYRVIMHARRGGFAKDSLEEHQEILKALEADDMPRAAKAVEHHRLRSMRRLGETA